MFDAGHEIGHHGWTHMPPNDMSREEEEEGIVRGNEQIRKLTGRNARGYRSPSWDLSPHSVELHAEARVPVRKQHDGQRLHALPRAPGRCHRAAEAGTVRRPTPLIEMPVSWTLDDYPHFEFLRTKTYVLPG